MAKVALLVDDSRVARMILKKTIREIAPGWSTEEAGDGNTALDMMQAKAFDLVFIDFHMPGMDGLETAAKIKAKWPDMAITLLTANIQKEMKQRAEELGIGYITKPADKGALLEVLGG